MSSCNNQRHLPACMASNLLHQLPLHCAYSGIHFSTNCRPAGYSSAAARVSTADCMSIQVCTHRASRVMSGEGNAHQFRCPYHAWTYDLQGRFRGCGLQDTLNGISNFTASDNTLTPIRCETWGSLIYLNFSNSRSARVCLTVSSTFLCSRIHWVRIHAHGSVEMSPATIGTCRQSLTLRKHVPHRAAAALPCPLYYT